MSHWTVRVRVFLLLVALILSTLGAPGVRAQGSAPLVEPGIVLSSLPPSGPPAPTPAASGGDAASPVPNVASQDDRDNTTPTAWSVWARQTAQQVSDTVNLGYRLVDITVDAISPDYLFTGVYVANSGAYGKTWWWYYGVDAATLNSILSSNQARLTSLKAYDIGGGQIRFAAVMISNTGGDQSGWWWYYNATPADIASQASTNQARLTQLHAYQTGGQTRYAVVMVDNSGAAGRSWWWYINASVSSISSALQSNGARLVDLDVDPVTGNYNVIMDGCTSDCPLWCWYVGVPENQLIQLSLQNGARIIDANRYTGCGGSCYDVVLINNSNAITSRVGQILRSGTDGVKGLYLRQVGGPVLANLMDGYVFEPASALKVAVHLYTLRQVQARAVTLTTLIPRYAPPVSGSCPGNTVIGAETIETADREAMWHSDNTRTRELVDYFGVANINAYMSAIGMTHSRINHVLGCGGPVANQTTLEDLAALYEGVATGALLSAANRTTFYGNMAGSGQYAVEGYDWTGLVTTAIPQIVDQEAPPGMPTFLKDAFKANMQVSYKAGNYKLCTSGNCATYVDHIAIFGHARIPFGDARGSREYIFGIFINDATSDAASGATFNAAKAELLREQIHAGLAASYYRVALPLVARHFSAAP